MNVTLRQPVSTDLHFILDTWLKSYRSSSFAKDVSTQIFYTQHQDLVMRILRLQSSAISILCSGDDLDQIIGYIAYDTKSPIIHYVYIKYPFRKFGLSVSLLEGALELHKSAEHVMITHLPQNFRHVVKKFPKLIYNPYLLGAYAASYSGPDQTGPTDSGLVQR